MTGLGELDRDAKGLSTLGVDSLLPSTAGVDSMLEELAVEDALSLVLSALVVEVCDCDLVDAG